MRPEELTRRRHAAGRLLQTYEGLAARGEHLLGRLVGERPVAWQHYPAEDAIDRGGAYQWFYHSHASGDRPGQAEHGHVHLFARRRAWIRRLRSNAEREFAAMTGSPAEGSDTRHLLAIGFDAKGLPTSLFTVNGWVTGDLMLSASLTLKLLDRMDLDTGYAEVDSVVQAVVTLCSAQLADLMARRDDALRSSRRRARLQDESLEVLSSVPFGLDGACSGES